jgi:hypothetical protein
MSRKVVNSHTLPFNKIALGATCKSLPLFSKLNDPKVWQFNEVHLRRDLRDYVFDVLVPWFFKMQQKTCTSSTSFCRRWHATSPLPICLMLNARRQTRAAIQASWTCYDCFLLGIITSEAELCAHCFDYNAIVIKKRPQHEMDWCFQCWWSHKGAELLKVGELKGSCSRKADQDTAASNHEQETEDNSKSHTTKRARPYQYKNSCAVLQYLKKNCYKQRKAYGNAGKEYWLWNTMLFTWSCQGNKDKKASMQRMQT